MILKDNLYTIMSQSVAENDADFRIALDAEHFIYRAHFPNNPITPGVCLIQLVVELFGWVRGRNFSIKSLKKIKFTAPISPVTSPEVGVSLHFAESEGGWQIKALVKEGDTVFAKMSLILI